MDRHPSARLFVILARSAPVGVVLRRGPSNWVQVIRWRTDTDTFEEGHWFKGRIYERRSDLSPDGSLFIYFANQFNARSINDPHYTYAWTAISRPLYLTALALWPKGDCWHGGGLFLDPRTVWLNHRPGVATPHPDHQPQGLRIISNPEAYGEDAPVYWRRLQRDGWELLERGKFSRVRSRRWGYQAEQPEVWQRPDGTGTLRLLMSLMAIGAREPGRRYVLRFEVVGRRKPRIVLDGATWADWDHGGRLVAAQDGRLLTFDPHSATSATPRVLADFNERVPAPLPPPEWATRW
jgi:hypothetical protein